MDLSLDDIIKKNKINRGPQKPRSRPQNTGGRRDNANSRSSKPLQSNGRVSKLPRKPLQSGSKSRPLRTSKNGVTDARLRIIEQNRRRMTDAREKLSEIAKQTDARTKIKGRNLKPAQQLHERRDQSRNRSRLSQTNSKQVPVMLQRSIKNNLPSLRDPSSLIRCTINRPEMNFSLRPSSLYVDDIDMPLSVRPRNDLSGIKVVTQNDYTHYDQEYLPAPEPMYVDNYNPPVFRQLEPSRGLPRGGGGRMSQEMRARLDSPVKPYSYHATSPSPPPSQGHRIVVSNLHSKVSHEDIKELFEDIGPLLTSRLVRAGTAEVIYKLQRDAKKAVEAYHNRQLDGQPMKCLLVNPRSPTGSSGVLRSSNMPSAPKFVSSSKSMVVPDLTAIHKALFTTK